MRGSPQELLDLPPSRLKHGKFLPHHPNRLRRPLGEPDRWDPATKPLDTAKSKSAGKLQQGGIQLQPDADLGPFPCFPTPYPTPPPSGWLHM